MRQFMDTGRAGLGTLIIVGHWELPSERTYIMKRVALFILLAALAGPVWAVQVKFGTSGPTFNLAENITYDTATKMYTIVTAEKVACPAWLNSAAGTSIVKAMIDDVTYDKLGSNISYTTGGLITIPAPTSLDGTSCGTKAEVFDVILKDNFEPLPQ